VDAIRELRDEHDALTAEAHAVRRALAEGDAAGAAALLAGMVDHLGRHVRREESGVFAALREQGDFADEVEALEGEHVHLDAAIAALDPAAPDFGSRVCALLDELAAHIEREDLGIFPVSVVTLGARGWETVDAAHREVPTFVAQADDQEVA
jgi:hemerythrin-like domain-containing protein